MKWFFAALIVLSPALLYFAAIAISVIKDRWWPPFCPKCNSRGISYVNGVRTTSPPGFPKPQFYRCRNCSARLYQADLDAEYESAEDEKFDIWYEQMSIIGPCGNENDTKPTLTPATKTQ